MRAHTLYAWIQRPGVRIRVGPLGGRGVGGVDFVRGRNLGA